MPSGSTPKLQPAIEEYLEWAKVHAFRPGTKTPRTYRIKLNQYARHFGLNTRVGELSGQDWYRACNALWKDRSPETYNSARRAAISFLTFCRDTEPPYTTAEPPKLWRPRPVPRDRSKALPEKTVQSLFAPDTYPLRERALWSLLYDSSERLEAILSLDIDDLDLKGCYATARIKGGDTRYLAWSPGTCELLKEYIGTRTWGPVFLGDQRPWNWRDKPPGDQGPDGRYRLTAHRARIVYAELTGLSRPHRLRHSRLTHLSAAGANSPMLKAISGHASDRMLAHYSRPGPEMIARFMAEVADKANGKVD